jgi:hypothetical protein
VGSDVMEMGSEGRKFGKEWFAMPIGDINRHFGDLDFLGSGLT